MKFRKFNVFIVTILVIVFSTSIWGCAEEDLQTNIGSYVEMDSSPNGNVRKNNRGLINEDVGLSMFSTEAENIDMDEDKDINRVLLIEENLPWDSNANTQVLNSLGMSVTVIDMLEFSDIDLSSYYVVIVANDQDLAFYVDYNTVKSKLAEYVEKGGILLMGACDSGWAYGVITSGLPGEVQLAPVAYDDYNYVVDKTHPIVTGELTDNVELADADLYSHYCSHREFVESSLPQGSKIILRSKNSNNPTLVEYPYGFGKVIASGLTWEHNYTQHTGNDGYGIFARKSMDDYFAYGISLINSSRGYEFRRTIGIEFEQTSQPLSGTKVPEIKAVSYEYDEEENYYNISITDYTVDNGASPFFFWKTHDGYFIDASEDYKTVKFIPNPGTEGKMVEVKAFIGDDLGHTNEYSIELEGKRPLAENGMNLEIVSNLSNVKGDDVYKIEYIAKQTNNGKLIPGTSVDIFYTLDGKGWTQIADGLLDKSSYEWKVPDIKSDSTKIKIVAQNGTKIKTIESSAFKIAPPYYIEGRVLDLNNSGVAGVTVECAGIKAITDSSGHYKIRGLDRGSYVVKVSAENKLFVKSVANVHLDDNNYCAYKIFRVK